ncbi:hypothetical protein CKO27_09840 [Thiocystis violacea]|nr:hypothetical protein [Thiocystis violacea]
MDEAEMDFPDVPLLFGRFLVLGGFLTEADITGAIRVQRDLSATAMFVLVEQGLFSLEEIERLRACQRDAMVTLREAARRLRLPASGDLDAALDLVARQHARLGEVLVKQGKITRETLAAALEQHQRHQDLRGF